MSFITCDELTFTLGRPMQVLTLFNYGFGSGSDLDPAGDCRATLDGGVTSSVIRMIARDQAFSSLGGIPVVDVISLGAGTHTIGLQCREEPPADNDIEIQDVRLAAVELAMD